MLQVVSGIATGLLRGSQIILINVLWLSGLELKERGKRE